MELKMPLKTCSIAVHRGLKFVKENTDNYEQLENDYSSKLILMTDSYEKLKKEYAGTWEPMDE